MKYLVILALAIAGVACKLESGLKFRFGAGLSGYFMDAPQTEEAAQSEGWLLTDVPSQVDGLKAYCYQDYVVCIYFEAGYAAGVQACLSQNNYTDSIYDWEVQGFNLWTAPNEEKYMCTQQYFVDNVYMSQDEETRNAKRDTKELLQNDGVWVTGFNRELVHVPGTKKGLDSSDFTKQACFPFMGNHYYYKMTEDLECAQDTIFPYFPLEYKDHIIGMGLMTFGKLPEGKFRDWFERPAKMAVQAIVPRGPDCLYNNADNPGVVTMHVYYIKNQLRLNCLF